MKSVVLLTSLLTGLVIWQIAPAEVVERRISDDFRYYKVSDESWQPEDFENGSPGKREPVRGPSK